VQVIAHALEAVGDAFVQQQLHLFMQRGLPPEVAPDPQADHHHFRGRLMICAAIDFWQPIASMLTTAPWRVIRSSSFGIAVISLPLPHVQGAVQRTQGHAAVQQSAG